MIEILSGIPKWYYLIAIVFSLYYAIRGIIVEIHGHPDEKLSPTERMIVFYIQEFIFKVIFTMSSFMALAIAKHIFESIESLNEIGAGAAILLVFLFVWGITGVSGYLTFLLITGKLPGVKT